MIDLTNNTVSLDLFKNVLRVIKQRPAQAESLIDSFSDNQFSAKVALVESLCKIGAIDTTTRAMIMGSWYGSILTPLLLNHTVDHIVTVDLDDLVNRTARHILFPSALNVEHITDDIFNSKQDWARFAPISLYINTSCEHMAPMATWMHFNKGAYFAFQSNNMYDIIGHVNCVGSLNDFKAQLPHGACVMLEEEIKDTRGARYMLIGKFDE